jgi:hypothetical protein
MAKIKTEATTNAPIRESGRRIILFIWFYDLVIPL